MEKFKSDFKYFWELITKGENFTFARYADGEVMLMKGLEVNTNTQAYTIDKWLAPNMITSVGVELKDTLKHKEANYFYAISSKTDNIGDYIFLYDNIENKDRLTFVNLWINGNYNDMLLEYNKLTRPVNLICNYKARKENFPFKVSNITGFPNDCINFWGENGSHFISELLDKFKNVSDELFFISCGPISEIIIHNLYLNNPNNTYVDVGSSIDEFVHGYKTRPYMNNNSQYSKMISSF